MREQKKNNIDFLAIYHIFYNNEKNADKPKIKKNVSLFVLIFLTKYPDQKIYQVQNKTY